MNFGIQDHCEAAYNAKCRVWPNIDINNCGNHGARMVLKSSRLRVAHEENAAPIRGGFRMLHSITIVVIFEHAIMLWYIKWESTEPNFVAWFITRNGGSFQSSSGRLAECPGRYKGFRVLDVYVHFS